MKIEKILNFSIIILYYFQISECNSQLYTRHERTESGERQPIEFNTNKQDQPGHISIQTTISFTKQYLSTPKILLGLSFLDYSLTVNFTQFQYSVKSIDQQKAVVVLEKEGETKLYGMKFHYFVVEDSNIQVKTLKLNLSDGLSRVVSFEQPLLPNKTREANCYMIGLKHFNPEKELREIGTQVKDITSQKYTIDIITNEVSALEFIVVNCIEYYKEPIGSYKMIFDAQTLSYEPTQMVDTYAATANITGNIYASPEPFIGIQSMTFKSNIIDQDGVRIRVYERDFIYIQHVYQVSAQTWYKSFVQNLKVGFFHYQMYSCQKNEEINKINFTDENKCVSQCPQKYFKQEITYADICTNCQSSCLICVNKSTCLTCDTRSILNSQNFCQKLCSWEESYIYDQKCFYSKPPNTYCDGIKVCQKCVPPCKECETSTKCTSCIPFYYLFNGICSIDKPKNTYCKIKI